MNRIGRVVRRLLPAVGLILCLSAGAAGQQDTGVLQELEEKMATLVEGMSQAQALQVHYLSPLQFRQASQNLADARAEFNGKRNIQVLRDKLNRAETHLGNALRNSKEAKKQLPDLIQARDEALEADVPTYTLQEYEAAETQFRKAMEKIENTDLNGAVREGKKAQEMFRDAELKAIKINIIGPVHERLKEAKKAKAEKYAPVSYARAQALIEEAEKILVSDRQEQAQARRNAEEAAYEARHAIYISNRVDELRKSDENWEKLMLEFEAAVRPAAESMNIQPRFDSGFTEPLSNLTTAIQALKTDRRDLNQQLGQAQKDLGELREETSRLAGQLDATRQQEESLKADLAAKKRLEEKIKRVENLFAENEATVLREKGDLVLRLAGLSFATGKSEIEVQYFGLLTKVQQALREFPGAPVTIEGHTDSRGHDTINMRLSRERANAIKSYLVANMGMDESRIVAVGFGKSKPIASNDTEEGRRINRRIDVVIDIGDALY